MTKELMIPENITPAIFTDEKKSIAELLKSVGTKVVAFKGDISTEEGRKETKDFGKLINRSKNAVDDMGKEHVAKLKELPKKIDAQRKLFRDGMDEYKDTVLAPLAAWQEVEDKRVEAHENNITMIIENGNDCLADWQIIPIADLRSILHKTKGFCHTSYEEFALRANQVAIESIEKIETAIAKRVTFDTEQAELEQLRKEKAEREQKDRDEAIKQEVAEKAKREAEKKAELEARKKEAEAEVAKAKLEQEKLRIIQEKEESERKTKEAEQRAQEAEARGKREAEEAVIRERERVEAAKEKERQETAKREADAKHKAAIDDGIIRELIEAGIPTGVGMSIIKAINDGLISNIKINY